MRVWHARAPALRAWKNAPLYRRARACPSPPCGHTNDRGGQAPALRYPRRAHAGDRPPRYGPGKTRPFTVGRGPVPRQRPGTREIAGDRPPRYGNKNGTRATILKTPPTRQGKHRTPTSSQRPLTNLMPRTRNRKRDPLILDVYEQRCAIG